MVHVGLQPFQNYQEPVGEEAEALTDPLPSPVMWKLAVILTRGQREQTGVEDRE